MSSRKSRPPRKPSQDISRTASRDEGGPSDQKIVKELPNGRYEEERKGEERDIDAIKIPLTGLIDFLSASGRRIECPVCQQSGGWRVHGGDFVDGEQYAVIYRFKAGGGYADTPVILMECPKCAYIQTTGALSVVKFLEANQDGE